MRSCVKFARRGKQHLLCNIHWVHCWYSCQQISIFGSLNFDSLKEHMRTKCGDTNHCFFWISLRTSTIICHFYLNVFVFVFMCMCLYFVNIVFLSQFYLSQSSRFCHYLSQKNCYVPCITMIISFLHHNDYLSIFSNESCTYECSIFWRFLNVVIKSNLDTTLSLPEYLLSCL